MPDAGATVRPAVRPSVRPSVRLATWNIHRCIGGDRRRDVGRIVQAILALDADVVALQEVETPTQSAAASSAFHLLHALASHGYKALPGPTIIAHSHSYGNLLLSRLPVRQCIRVELSQPGREPRGLIDVRLDVGRPRQGNQPSAVLRCIATHLGLGRAERRAQITDIARRIQPSRDLAGCPEPMVLLGDFNEWRRQSRRLLPIDQLLQQVPSYATFPARWPLLALDRIWYRGCRLEQCSSVRTGLTRIASDHLPLLASFQFVD